MDRLWLRALAYTALVIVVVGAVGAVFVLLMSTGPGGTVVGIVALSVGLAYVGTLLALKGY
ncbi:hypothetical protein [Thermomonospora cellulosilytica]|uniref:Uncharacterized protein n=1 Tax=Thermomonospora cellulosilytica TaxID=1411118 RepID=A0A7W3R641_9ACTN|nr:hypothetical protein [Thermomonospora cellulosilytica]MBA9001753.1 hypothetical protein [Thermomonospora cellulosilytica]